MTTKVKEAVNVVVKDASRFSQTVSRIAEACSSSGNVPILSCMKIDVKGGSAVFTGGDGIVTMCIGEKDLVHAEQDLSIAVPAALFSEIVRKLPTGEIKMAVMGEKLLIQVGTVKFDLLILNVEEYPTIVLDKNTITSFTIPASALVASIKRTTYACSINQSNPVLTGICFEIAEGGTDLKLTSTDRNRLARSFVEGIVGSPFRQSVATKSCKELVRVFEGMDSEVKISFTESVVSIIGPGVMMISKVLEGNYPDTDKLYPKDYIAEFSMEREKLLGALTRAQVFAGKNKKMVIFTIREDGLSITSKAEVGQVVEAIDCQTHGTELQIGFDVVYFIDALKSIEQKEVRLSFSGPQTPLVIAPVDNNLKVNAIVIPMRITA